MLESRFWTPLNKAPQSGHPISAPHADATPLRNLISHHACPLCRFMLTFLKTKM